MPELMRSKLYNEMAALSPVRNSSPCKCSPAIELAPLGLSILLGDRLLFSGRLKALAAETLLQGQEALTKQFLCLVYKKISLLGKCNPNRCI
jgi:hypothetical protein